MIGMSHVYVLSSPDGYYKIGSTSGQVDARIRQFSIALPFKVEVHCSFMCAGGTERQVERLIHNQFAGKRANGEWFKLDEEDLEWLHQNPLPIPIAASHEMCYAQECLRNHSEDHIMSELLGLS